MSHMKLLIISPDYSNMIGGVADYTYNLSKALINEGIEVYVLTSENSKVKLEDKPKVLPLISNWGFLSLFRITKVIKEIKPDFINLQYVPYIYNHYGMPVWIIFLGLWIYLNGFKLCTTFHEFAIKFDLNLKYWIPSILQWIVVYVLSVISNKIVVTTKYAEKSIFLFKEKIVVIRIGSNIQPCLISDDEKSELRKKIVPQGGSIITTFGNLAPYRRDDVFLEAVSVLVNLKLSKPFKVIIFGSAPKHYTEKLQGLVEKLKIGEIVQFLGYLEPYDAYKYLSISDIFVMLSSRPDNGGIGMMSTSVAAAYAAGLPIIGAKGLATDDFFKDGENVLFAKSFQVNDVADVMMELIKDAQLRSKLSKGAKECYHKELEWSVLGKKYIALIKS